MTTQADIPPPLHELEAEVMQAVWAAGQDEVTVREMMDVVNGQAASPRAYTTYMTTMRRLDAKGLLTRRREGKTDIYRPVYSPEEYADRRAQAGVNALVEQYGEVALGHFARQMAELDPQRRRQLQRLASKR
jgi:predicted transcriptional regulator